MNPFTDIEAYRFILGGVTWVGEVTLSGGDIKPQWDVKAAKGQEGASSTLTSPSQIRKFKAVFQMANDPSTGVDQFAAWDAFQKVIESTINGTVPKALPVYYPDLARVRITNCCHDGIGIMQHDGKGGATVAVDFIEHRPKKKKPSASATSANSANATKKVDPNAARKVEVGKLRERALKL